MSNCLCLDCKKNQKLPSESAKTKSESRRTVLTKLIQDNPGIQFRDLMRLTSLKNGVLSHHLRILEKTESVKAERLPRQTRFYPEDFSDEESVVTRALRRNTPRDIIYTLMLNDKNGLDFSQIVSDVSKSPSTVSLYLSQLIKDNIVTTVLGFGRKKKYRLSKKQLVDRLIENYKPRVFDKSVSGFEDIINSL